MRMQKPPSGCFAYRPVAGFPKVPDGEPVYRIRVPQRSVNHSAKTAPPCALHGRAMARSCHASWQARVRIIDRHVRQAGKGGERDERGHAQLKRRRQTYSHAMAMRPQRKPAPGFWRYQPIAIGGSREFHCRDPQGNIGLSESAGRKSDRRETISPQTATHPR